MNTRKPSLSYGVPEKEYLPVLGVGTITSRKPTTGGWLCRSFKGVGRNLSEVGTLGAHAMLKIPTDLSEMGIRILCRRAS